MKDFEILQKGSCSGERNPSLKPSILAWARLRTDGTSKSRSS